MARSILAAVRQIKADVAQFLKPQLIETVCETIGHVWRERVLDPAPTVHLFVLQILHGNTACPHVPCLSGVACTGEAYCQARLRLPLRLLQYLLRALSHYLGASPMLDEGRWHGHRTFLLDGSSVSTADTPELQEAFGQPGAQKPGCGFPVIHLLALFHATTGFLLNVVAAPLRTHDMSQAARVHPDLEPGDILVGDRGFCSFVHVALLAARGIFGVFRMHQKQIVSFRPHRRAASKHSRQRKQRGLPSSRWLKRLGRHDQLVEYRKPTAKNRPSWLSLEAFAAVPKTLVVREIRYTIAVRGRRTRLITLATTLLDPVRYPKAD